MKLTRKLAGVALAVALAAPALAEAADAPAADAPRVVKRVMVLNGSGSGHEAMAMGGGMLHQLSPEGRDIMRQAMASGPREVNRAAVKAARNKMLDVLAAEKLDVAALRNAMTEERSIAARQQEANQAAMLAAFQKLSAADRKAFAASMQGMHRKLHIRTRGGDDRMIELRERLKTMHKGHGDMPPPPPPPPAGG